MDELLREAHRKAIERFYTERMNQARSIEDPVERLVATIDSGVASGPDDQETRLIWEGVRLAGESELFSVLMTTLYKQQELLYENILELGAAVGVFKLADDVHRIAETLVALEDICGVRMSRTIGPSTTPKASGWCSPTPVGDWGGSARIVCRHGPASAFLAPLF